MRQPPRVRDKMKPTRASGYGQPGQGPPSARTPARAPVGTCAEDLAGHLLQEGRDLPLHHGVAPVPVLVVVVLLDLLLLQLALLHHELAAKRGLLRPRWSGRLPRASPRHFST